MVAAASTASVAEDEDALLVVHERLRLGVIGGTGAVLDAEPVAFPHDPPRAASDLRDHVCAEAVHDLVERALHRRQCRQMLDHTVAALDGVPALHRLPVAKDWPRREVALAVPVKGSSSWVGKLWNR